MILYQLKCSHDHQFEAWFRDSADFDSQAGQGIIACPFCADSRISKALMSPNLNAKKPDKDKISQAAAKIRQQMNGLRKHVSDNADYVGRDFPEEARRIHYKEAEERGIYGEATSDDVRDLIDEGVEVFPLPPAPEDQN